MILDGGAVRKGLWFAYRVSAIPNDTTENCKWIRVDEITVDRRPYHGICICSSNELVY
jgi:hypothetical protein